MNHNNYNKQANKLSKTSLGHTKHGTYIFSSKNAYMLYTYSHWIHQQKHLIDLQSILVCRILTGDCTRQVSLDETENPEASRTVSPQVCWRASQSDPSLKPVRVGGVPGGIGQSETTNPITSNSRSTLFIFYLLNFVNRRFKLNSIWMLMCIWVVIRATHARMSTGTISPLVSALCRLIYQSLTL